ncbi:hypothetical protein NPIL_489611, partial [Nephila pilipes]
NFWRRNWIRKISGHGDVNLPVKAEKVEMLAVQEGMKAEQA